MMDRQPDRKELDDSIAIDRICDQFERSCRLGKSPKISEYLTRIEARLQSRLFEQLLSLELEFSSQAPSLEDYLEQFPSFETQLKTVFEEFDLLDRRGSEIGPFRIERELARGGMGIIYLAHDSRLDRQVAIKLLSRERRADAKWLRRFRREARLASGLSHPNIVTIYEIGDEDGGPFIVSEYVDGQTIHQRMKGQRLPIGTTLQIASQASLGMIAAHEAGIIHRDLKADNVMIRDDGLVKILDFGLAKPNAAKGRSGSAISGTNSISGTAPYMSPEQARGQSLTTQSDVFSFGVLLYLMLEGKLPFRGDTATDVIASILNNEPDGLTKAGNRVPKALGTLVEACLRKNPTERPNFKQILEVVDRLRNSLGKSWIAEEDQKLASEETRNLSRAPSTWSTKPLQGLKTRLSDQPSPIRYAKSQDINIAWQEVGSGPIDIVFVMGWVSHLEWFWKDPSFASFLRHLASFARVILFDKRGTGLSDKVAVNELPDLETRMDDVRAVMDAAGSNQAVLCGVSEGGPLCALFAATYPEKTIALTMVGSYSRRLWAEDYPWGPSEEAREAFLKEIATNWGGPLGLEERAPSQAEDPAFRHWWSSYLRMGASPGAAVALTRMNAQIDIRQILPSIQVPTLVIHRTGDRCLSIEEGRYLANRIPNAAFVELPGNDHLPFVGDSESIVTEIESFLEGLSGAAHIDSVLATVLHVNIVTQADSAWIQQFKTRITQELDSFRGRNLVDLNQAMLMTFDGPVRAILCARAISRLASRQDILIQCGLDTGICNIDKSVVYGPAIDSAKRITEQAPQAAIVVSENLRNLISSAQLEFEPFEAKPNENGTKEALFKVTY